MKKIYLAWVMLLSLGSTLWIEKVSAGSVHVIRNNSDWIAFRDAVGSAGGSRVDARLETDITTDAVIGWNTQNAYAGTFDGNGHTLTVNYHRDANSLYNASDIAPFRYVDNATFKDLHVTGKVYSGRHAGGLIGYCTNKCTAVTLNRVWVSTEVNSNDYYAGGIIAHSNVAHVYMNDCRFDGSVTAKGSNWNDTNAGEIIGWANTNGSGWRLMRVYDAGSPNAHWMFYCISGGGASWNTNEHSFTVSRHAVWAQNYKGINDQAEVVKIMNGFKADTWELVDGKAVPKKKTNQNSSEFQADGWTFLEESQSSGYTLQSGRYYVNDDVMFENGATGSGLTISSGATVYIYIPKGVTLTAQGGNASGQTGAGAGIHLPQSTTLYLLGEGELKAYGGHAANGCNGSQGQGGNWTGSISGNYGGNGGNGGAGGGGAGAGIGTCGANGGNGGSGGRTPV